MNGGPSGFNNAPITRAFVISCAIFTIIFGIQGRSNKLGFSYQDIFNKLQLWKLVVSVFAFASTPELMFGSYLLYYFRVFERQIGSNKHSLTFVSCIIGYYIFKFNERVFILFTLIVSSLLEVLALALLNDPSLNPLASGPYGLIFSAFVPFFLDIPVSTRFRVFSLRFSDKSFIYLVGIQLLLSSWKSSIIPGICGILAGTLYRLNIFCIGRMKFPEYIASFFSRLSWPSMGSTSPTAPTRNVPSYVGRQVEANHPAPVSLSSMVEPPEDSIATLVSMGFDRNSARQALVHARNDIDTATNILLESQSC